MYQNWFLLVIIAAISLAGVQRTDLDSDLKRGLDKGFGNNKPILKGSQTKSGSPQPRGSLSTSALLLPTAERNRHLFAKGGIVLFMRACHSGEITYSAYV